MRSGIPAELYELGLGSTLSVNTRAQDAEGAAAFIDYLTQVAPYRGKEYPPDPKAA